MLTREPLLQAEVMRDPREMNGGHARLSTNKMKLRFRPARNLAVYTVVFRCLTFELSGRHRLAGGCPLERWVRQRI